MPQFYSTHPQTLLDHHMTHVGHLQTGFIQSKERFLTGSALSFVGLLAALVVTQPSASTGLAYAGVGLGASVLALSGALFYTWKEKQAQRQLNQMKTLEHRVHIGQPLMKALNEPWVSPDVRHPIAESFGPGPSLDTPPLNSKALSQKLQNRFSNDPDHWISPSYQKPNYRKP